MNKAKSIRIILVFICMFFLTCTTTAAERPEIVPTYKQPNVNKSITPNKKPGRFLGKYKITFYTACPQDNNNWVDAEGHSITATGNHVIPYQTAAVLRNSIPYGTSILIVGHGVYIVDDCGVGPRQVDLAVESKEEARHLGVQYCDVYILYDDYNFDNEDKLLK